MFTNWKHLLRQEYRRCLFEIPLNEVPVTQHVYRIYNPTIYVQNISWGHGSINETQAVTSPRLS